MSSANPLIHSLSVRSLLRCRTPAFVSPIGLASKANLIRAAVRHACRAGCGNRIAGTCFVVNSGKKNAERRAEHDAVRRDGRNRTVATHGDRKPVCERNPCGTSNERAPVRSIQVDPRTEGGSPKVRSRPRSKVALPTKGRANCGNGCTCDSGRFCRPSALGG